jgi:sulfhydrogenase subunit beta (sulfur reductase)
MLQPKLMSTSDLATLIEQLRDDGFAVIAPKVRDGAIALAEIETLDDLPRGWRDEQEAGHYRLHDADDDALFAYTVGPHSVKQFFHPPERRLWTARRGSEGIEFEADADSPRYAFLGVRACDLRAVAIQDRVLMGGDYIDPHYARARESALFIAVNCAQAAPTCFCTSQGSGPTVDSGHDLALTELEPGRFLVEIGSDRGAELLRPFSLPDAGSADSEHAAQILANTAEQMTRHMPADARNVLLTNPEHPHWQDVGDRCLSCGNCTAVCPTCFCTTVEDHTDLAGEVSERHQRWDSCFSNGFSYVHGGGTVRSGTPARYRQWITHKLATWHDQFDESGCVGCGRCIAWCPVGIDITQEVATIAEDHHADND